MGMILIAFPAGRQKMADRIGELLISRGFRDTLFVKTGSEALRKMSRLAGGILICSRQLPDMHYTELLDYMPPHFEMLLLDGGPPGRQIYADNIVILQMPVKVHELIETVRIMDRAGAAHRAERFLSESGRNRDPRDENYIRNAKEVLRYRRHMSEEEAHRYLQKTSMDSGRSLAETAQMVLLMAVME